ncbi:hypothetical protein BJD55_gp022 [Gordonia phage Yvonnetastic]|uniref:Uncharacterized protein n=1 Tax=Gordonia phage Yvonnetastic TaxID=1821566 RepID=A0A142K9G1_9CAUD|nr:hypothetical protein BJD55_gp022 [Gordonia phage Yvonnetastic]AMS02744.1 hypothetical protein SEA_YVONNETASTIC_200 [Gordonia phage Yvonnetastic]WKW86176.1 hypothetical protein SEA_JONJAMES_199 [Gordonia Phage JonJames]
MSNLNKAQQRAITIERKRRRAEKRNAQPLAKKRVILGQ